MKEFIMVHFLYNFLWVKTVCELKLLGEYSLPCICILGVTWNVNRTTIVSIQENKFEHVVGKTASILSRPRRVDICRQTVLVNLWLCAYIMIFAHIILTLPNKIFKLCRVVIYSFEQLQTFKYIDATREKFISFPTILFILQCDMSSPKLNDESCSIWCVTQHMFNFVKMRSCWNHSFRSWLAYWYSSHRMNSGPQGIIYDIVWSVCFKFIFILHHNITMRHLCIEI